MDLANRTPKNKQTNKSKTKIKQQQITEKQTIKTAINNRNQTKPKQTKEKNN